MSCSQNPVNIKNTKQICREDCSYEFDYNQNSSAIIQNMGDYLDIKIDGKNDVKFNKVHVTVTDVRLYQPSFHLFNGQQAAAELVIQHSNPMGDSVLVCIPVIERDGKGDSNSFFSQIIPHLSNEEKIKQNVNVSAWSLNNIVPSSPFFYYIGPYPFKPCSGKVNVIIYDMDDAATIGSANLKQLKSLISPIEYSKAQKIGGSAENDVILLKNLLGASGPRSDKADYYLLSDCDAVSGIDEPDSTNPKTIDNSGDRQGLPGFLLGLLGILVLVIVIYLLYALCTTVDISKINFGKVADNMTAPDDVSGYTFK